VVEQVPSHHLYPSSTGLDTPNRFETIGAMLSRRGHSGARITRMAGGDFARVTGEAWS
jgi:membrane dipeptidase